jgi:rRNA processing protein Krr1/Pno1
MQDIKVLVEKKTELERKKERLLGKLESAKNSLQEIDNRLISLGFNPDNLEEEIHKLKQERDLMLENFEKEVNMAEDSINRIEQRLKEI